MSNYQLPTSIRRCTSCNQDLAPIEAPSHSCLKGVRASEYMSSGFFICPSCQIPVATSERATHELAHYLDENPEQATRVMNDFHAEDTQVYEQAQMLDDEDYAMKLQAEFNAEIEEEHYEYVEDVSPNQYHEEPYIQQYQQPPSQVVSGITQYITTDASGQPQVHVHRYTYSNNQHQPQLQQETYNMQDLGQGGYEQRGFLGSMWSNSLSMFQNHRNQVEIDTGEQRDHIVIMRNDMHGPMEYESLLRLDQDLYEPGHGADQGEISELPTYIFHPIQHGNEKCSVCLSDLRDGEQAMKLPCFHTFHKDCITEWLVRKAECPVCKTPLSE